MERRIVSNRTGLLIVIGILSICSLEAQSFLAAIEQSPENPVVQSQWVLSVLINHNIPSQVKVRAPTFPSALGLERVRTESRRIPPTNVQGTAIDFFFKPRSSGRFTIETFEIAILGTVEKTEPFEIIVHRERYTPPILRWNTPQYLTVGVKSILTLTVQNGSVSLPQSFLTEIPEQVLIELRYPSNAEQRNGTVVQLTVIPLSAEPFRLNALHVLTQNGSVTIPALTLPVRPAVPKLPIPEEPEEEAVPVEKAVVQPFPAYSNNIFDPARTLWEEGHISESLAYIRRLERERFFSRTIIAFRKEVEQCANILFRINEPWRPKRFFIILIMSLFVCSTIGVILLRRSAHWFIPVVVGLILAGICIVPLVDIPHIAVVHAGTGYRIPDKHAAVSGSFGEGQPVHVLSEHAQWAHIEVPNGHSFWIKTEQLVRY
ncbi:MAG: hypothetical protein LBQ77_07105 [Treponema sp.]|jgi:hypothetical protein|nr:hypothetical protein [Treponema sp.]